MNGHPALFQAIRLNWSKSSPDDMYRSLQNIWNVSTCSFISSSLHCAGAPLNYGNTKGPAFGLFVPNGCVWGPACPLPLCDCVCCVIRCDTKTSLSSSLCQPAALHWKPALTAMTPNLIGPVTPSDPSAIEMVLKSTNTTCRPLDYCINTLLLSLCLLTLYTSNESQ